LVTLAPMIMRRIQ